MMIGPPCKKNKTQKFEPVEKKQPQETQLGQLSAEDFLSTPVKILNVNSFKKLTADDCKLSL